MNIRPVMAWAACGSVLVAGCASGEDRAPAETPPAPSSSQSVRGKPSEAPLPSDFEWPSSRFPSPSSGAEHRGFTDVRKANRSDPESVSRAFVQALWSTDFRAEGSRAPASVRASTLADGRLRASLSQPGEDVPSRSWEALHLAGGWSEVTVRNETDDMPDQRPADTETGVSWRVDVRFHGASVPAQTFIVHTWLQREGQRWSVIDYSLDGGKVSADASPSSRS